MVGEVRRDGDDGGAAGRQAELAEALQEACRLLHAATGEEPAGVWSPVIERLTGIETALREHGEDFSVVFVFVGLVLGTRQLRGGEHGSSGSGAEERAQALRRLRWADRNGPVDDLLVVQARMLLVFLLVPWALPRADGTDTVLRSALLTPGYGEDLPTESVRRDLGEAKEIVDRIAAAPIGAEFEQGTANVKRVIERMLAPGTTLFDTPSPTPAGGRSMPWATPRPRCSTPYAVWWPSPVRAARRRSPASCSGCWPPCCPGPVTTRTRSWDAPP
ncbi:hypothetical protein [Streptomyces olivaceoviridis]|uniref:hypothetical protein n=1 Tax=Streptomyces olivaceoviridis TaxID=1921 RepID=UPI003316DB02